MWGETSGLDAFFPSPMQLLTRRIHASLNKDAFVSQFRKNNMPFLETSLTRCLDKAQSFQEYTSHYNPEQQAVHYGDAGKLKKHLIESLPVKTLQGY